jgi:transcriptional regulator with XRE-family HTH domain
MGNPTLPPPPFRGKPPPGVPPMPFDSAPAVRAALAEAKRLGLSNNELARRAELTPSAITRLTADPGRNVPATTLAGLLAAVGRSWAWLDGVAPVPEPPPKPAPKVKAPPPGQPDRKRTQVLRLAEVNTPVPEIMAATGFGRAYVYRILKDAKAGAK